MNNKNKTLYDIKEVTKACAKGETVSFAITSKNKYSFFYSPIININTTQIKSLNISRIKNQKIYFFTF
ncbi:hypothetical protein [Halarcobacter sp.]|uniref:hypothetical protein n=1 Tax=Halarcobacter sp. TaxID=2321133 RepID=UPI002AA6EDD9|nr:hypothetical protein [Halarcobacter sp.]